MNFDHACSLDLAQKQSELYSNNIPVNAALPSLSDLDNSDNVMATASFRNTHSKCFFCGNKYHSRHKCTARDILCLKCSKKGHFAKVCKFVENHTSSSMLYHPILATINGGISKNTLSKASLDILLDGLIVRALIDTRSTENIISKALAEKHSHCYQFTMI